MPRLPVAKKRDDTETRHRNWRVNVSQNRRNWSSVIERLNRSRDGFLRIRMGSPGSAQVTRCRLLEQWDNVEIWTEGPFLNLRLD